MHQIIEPDTFGVVYYTGRNAVRHVETLTALDYWEACELAWARAPKLKVADFQIIEDRAAIAGGKSSIRAAAAALEQSRRETRGNQGRA